MREESGEPILMHVAAALWIPMLLLAVAAGYLFWRAGGSRGGIQRWARLNGYRLIECAQIYRLGPFPDPVPRGHGVFHVTVEEKDGRVRHGYVRCNIGIWGLFLNESSVRWED